MIPIGEAILVAGVCVAIYMVSLYVLSRAIKDASIVDVGWGLGFATLSLAIALVADVENDLFSFVHLLVTIWGIRLFLHILFRKAGKPEDWRYQNWREQWGKTFWWRSFLQVFVLQGILMLVIAAPVYASISTENTEFSPLVWIGASLWAIGFLFESIGDWQLSRFLKQKAAQPKKKKGKKQQEFIKTGLWRYTRHPNYFGEVSMWWGLWIMVASTDYGLWAIVSPLTITYLLLKVSGIPMLEKKWESNKEFQKYKRKTSAFLPLPPKNI